MSFSGCVFFFCFFSFLRYILEFWQGSENAYVMVHTKFKIYKSRSNTNFIWEVVFENLDKSLEYICDVVPVQ